MKIKVERFHTTENTTIGALFINGVRECFTLEDTFHTKKIPGETRIPKGKYKLDLRFEGGLYEKYSKNYDENHPMLWIRNVPDFTFIYFHVLNYHTETQGCIGVGSGITQNMDTGDYYITGSATAYGRIYYPIRKALLNGEKVRVWVKDKTQEVVRADDKIKLDGETMAVIDEMSKTEFAIGVWTGPGEKIPWYKFYKKNGFKRIAGLMVGVGALIVKTIAPELGVVVDIIGWSGGALLGIGGVDALKKNREKDGDTYVDKNKYLRFFADILIKLINQYVKKKGKSE